MRKTKSVKTEQGNITIRELTIAELRNCLEMIEKQKEPHIVDFMFDNMPSLIIAKSIGVDDAKELEKFTQTELQEIEEAVVELNPLASKMFEKLINISQTLSRQ